MRRQCERKPRKDVLSGAKRYANSLKRLFLLGTLILTARTTWAQQGSAASAPVSTSTGERILLFSGKSEDLRDHWMRIPSAPPRPKTPKAKTDPVNDAAKTENNEPTQTPGVTTALLPADWKIEDNAMIAMFSDLVTKEQFGDFFLHVEFRVPLRPEAKGQARGNSGVKLHGIYEIQILDSYGKAVPGTGDCGAVYTQAAPLVNACKPPMEWQTYDISFRAPRFDSNGSVVEPARVSVLQNGIPVQNNQIITGPTSKPKMPPSKPYVPPAKGPIRLQYHGNAVAFRNIWIMPLPPESSKKYD